jgi:hypothetical protein
VEVVVGLSKEQQESQSALGQEKYQVAYLDRQDAGGIYVVGFGYSNKPHDLSSASLECACLGYVHYKSAQVPVISQLSQKY